MTPIVTSIIHTLAFYDAVGSVPLTKVELYKYRISTESLSDVSLSVFGKVLDEEWPKLNAAISHHRGFYFLSKNRDAYRMRVDGGKTGIAKWRIAKRMIRCISFLPYVRMVGVTGSLARHTTNKQSDIDVLVVSKGGHIWTTRVFVSFLLHVLGKRKHGEKVKDRICLNHYIADSDLALRPKNLFSAHIYSSFVPMWSSTRTKESFLTQNKAWAQAYVPHAREEGLDRRTISQGLRLAPFLIEYVLSKTIAGWIDTRLKTFQLHKIQRNETRKRLRDYGEKPAQETQEAGDVILSDAALMFHHPRPRKKETLYLYKKNLKELGLM